MKTAVTPFMTNSMKLPLTLQSQGGACRQTLRKPSSVPRLAARSAASGRAGH
jgi:hypothetical protein